MSIVNGKAVTVLFSVVCLLGIQACGGSSGGGSHPTTTATFTGTIAGTNDTEAGTQTGTMDVTVKPAAASETAQISSTMTSTGTLTLAGGGTVDLTGTYDSTTGGVNLTGGGYTFTATLTDGVMDGTYGNTGLDTDGGFAGLDSTTDTVKTFCGTFIHGHHDSSGIFNLVVTATTVSGSRINYTSRHEYRTISGTRTGDTIDAVVDDTGSRGTGTIVGDTISGTFTNKEGTQGSFRGSVADCI